MKKLADIYINIPVKSIAKAYTYIIPEKFDILKHPNVGLTTDGNGKPYLHGAVDRAVASISLGDSLEDEFADDSLESEGYELLSDEDLEEIIQKYA